MSIISCNILLIFYLGISLLSGVLCSDIQGFYDTVLFKINWPGKDSADLLEVPDSESMTIVTSSKEKYKCTIPTTRDKSKESEETYEGPNALEILQPLFQQSSCTYRLESYWTYEVCHGRYVRQYHEDREATRSKTQEYYLGRWDKAAHQKLSQELDAGLHYPPPVKKLDGLSLPYIQLNLTDGTICDLNGQPRRTNVLYVCYTMGKHEIYSFKETSTCQYEMIVLSSLLCQHPKYKPQDTGEHPINCLPVDEAPRKPRNLRKFEAESLKLRRQRLLEDERLKKVFAVFSIDKIEKDGENRVRLELRAVEEDKDAPTPPPTPSSPSPDVITDTSPVENFLSGKTCLHGGSGWWKFEFCYGHSVEQYHVEQDNTRTTVKLGVFDREAHIAWLTHNPHKRPKPLPERRQLSHYYGGGSLCDKTGLPRETEVKLKCVENSSPGAVSLYLIEPHTCQYILGVESPLVCQMLANVDEYGLQHEVSSADLDDATVSDDDISELPRDEL
ncbi:endoplasmic reticulum lectin 1-like isoform X1 [Macrosteles quadrilineatus]|uniref:endoplasmic reticulum lectin 1-like isoform X1 n=1 Tax=Macrosteles quadrilineatus TaxID=74068 RepID=UPI0023E2A64A|nr:endoplasmic reticulum lectin 1-like isoform X1 [Macrosteles quadrilineatus]